MSKFTVGVGRANITPKYSVPLDGYGNTRFRMSEGAYDPQYTTCIAFTDETGETVLLFHNDLCRHHHRVLAARAAIAEATDVPEDHIILHATHNHSSADTTSGLRIMDRYIKDLENWMVEAALKAMTDRKPVEDMFVTSTQVEGVGFTRHYVMDDGSICGDNLSGTGTKSVAHVNEADRTLSLVKITREGGQDVILANFQSHPHGGGGAKIPYITSDMIGAMRDMMETEADCKFLYFSGASGNVNSTSRFKEENIAKTHIARGQHLARTAMRAASGYKKAAVGNIRLTVKDFLEEINHEEDYKYEDALRIAKLWASTNDRVRCVREGEPCGIYSPYHANAIVSRAKESATRVLKGLGVFSVGEVAFVIVPYEMFHQMGSYIREHSPFAMTFIMSLANGCYEYHPTRDAYDFHAYEACLTRAKPGEAEKQAEAYVELLKELYSSES